MADKLIRGIGIFIDGKEVENTIKSMAAGAARLKNEIAGLAIGSEAYNQKMRDLAQLTGNIRDHNAQLRGTASMWDKLKSGALNFAAVAGIAFGADQIVQYGVQLFKTGIQLDALQRKAEVVFGDQMPKATAAAKEHAASMGLTEMQYVSAAAAAQDLLIPMGFQRDAATEISLELVNLSGALSEWTGGQKSSEEVSTTLTKALLGEREELKQLGIAISDADVKARLAANGHAKLTGAALEQAKAQATLQLILEKSTDAQTAFATGAGSAIRNQAELSAKISEIGEKLARLLMPALNLVAGAIGDIVDLASATVDVFSEIGQAIGDVIDPANGASRAFQEQGKTVTNLQKNIVPLLDRYDELTSKSKLSKAEQAELKKIVEQVGVAVPQATTAVDAYGKALAISSTSARFWIEQEQARLKLLNQTAIQEWENVRARTEADLAQINADKEKIKGQLEAGKDDSPYKVVVNADSDGVLDKRVEQASALYDKLEGVKAQIAYLKGETVAPATDAPQTGGSGGGGTDEKEAKKLADFVKNLRQKVEETMQAARLEAIHDEEERAIEAIRQKYAKETEEATKGEFSKNASVRGLVSQLDVARQDDEARVRAEFLAKKLAADKTFLDEQSKQRAEAEAKEAQESTDFLEQREQERLDTKKKFAEYAADGQATEQLSELAKLELHFAELLRLADDYGISTTEIQAAYEQKKAQIAADSAKKQIDEQRKVKEAEMELLAVRAGALQQGAASLAGFFEQNSAMSNALFLVEKAAAVAALIISFQKERASIWANANANPLNIAVPGAAAAIAIPQVTAARIRMATGIATIAATAIQKFVAPQKFEGGYTDVIGATDGKNYRAQNIGRQKTGLLPNHPSLVLASEKGAEYFVAAEDLKNPMVANYVRIIDNISNARTATPQFASGGATAPITAAPPQNGAEMELLRDVKTLFSALLARLNQPIVATVPDGTVIDINRRFERLNDASSGFFKN
jgi:PAS domain-containing protein